MRFPKQIHKTCYVAVECITQTQQKKKEEGKKMRRRTECQSPFHFRIDDSNNDTMVLY